ncbi:hypothetical protein BBJ28_00009166 [Nothophytophthora sp. Chile5]|nr:hypothetical protein BBJ28_00009166 [Nothophytophthora sp. Chile5]
MPTRRSPLSTMATTDGVVRAPSEFSITRAVLPSMTATHELVVPRSMPITSEPAAAENMRLAAAVAVAGAGERAAARNIVERGLLCGWMGKCGEMRKFTIEAPLTPSFDGKNLGKGKTLVDWNHPIQTLSQRCQSVCLRCLHLRILL